jgi:hypothetical protein
MSTRLIGTIKNALLSQLRPTGLFGTFKIPVMMTLREVKEKRALLFA